MLQRRQPCGSRGEPPHPGTESRGRSGLGLELVERCIQRRQLGGVRDEVALGKLAQLGGPGLSREHQGKEIDAQAPRSHSDGERPNRSGGHLDEGSGHANAWTVPDPQRGDRCAMRTRSYRSPMWAAPTDAQGPMSIIHSTLDCQTGGATAFIPIRGSVPRVGGSPWISRSEAIGGY